MHDANLILTCVDGHYVGRLTRPLVRWERIDASLFEDMQGERIKNGMRIGACTCGQPWIGRGCNPHTEAGWTFHDLDCAENYQQLEWSMPVVRHGPQTVDPS